MYDGSTKKSKIKLLNYVGQIYNSTICNNNHTKGYAKSKNDKYFNNPIDRASLQRKERKNIASNEHIIRVDTDITDQRSGAEIIDQRSGAEIIDQRSGRENIAPYEHIILILIPDVPVLICETNVSKYVKRISYSNVRDCCDSTSDKSHQTNLSEDTENESSDSMKIIRSFEHDINYREGSLDRERNIKVKEKE